MNKSNTVINSNDKTLFITDLHIDNKLALNTPAIEEYQYDTIKYILDRAVKEYKITMVVIAGDLFDNATPSLNSYKRVFSLMNFYIKKYNLTFILLEGNHTYYSKKWTALALFSIFENKNIIVVNKKPLHYKDLYLIPWDYANNKTEKKVVDIIHNPNKYNDVSVVVLHCDIKGATLDNNIKMLNGINLNLKVDSEILLLSGHIHKYQILNKNESIEYIGSPYQLTFGDKQYKKQFIVYDNNEKTIQRVLYEPKYILKNIILNEDKDIDEYLDLINNPYSNIYFKIQYQNSISTDIIYMIKNSKSVLNIGNISDSLCYSDDEDDYAEMDDLDLNFKDSELDLSLYLINGLREFLLNEGLNTKQLNIALDIVNKELY